MFEKLFAKRGLSLDRMRVLLEVREAGSIVKAAEADPVRQSQYSRQLKELEEYFGAELTQRKGRTIALTPAGEELASLIKEHFVVLGNFRRRLNDETVPVFIGAGESLVHWVLVPLVVQLQKDIPGITLRLDNFATTEISKRLSNRDLDLGLLRADAVPPNTSRKSIGKVAYALYVPPELESLCGKKGVACLSHLPMAVLPTNTSSGRALHQAAERSGASINVRLVCNSYTGLAQALRTGAYATVLPGYAEPHLDKQCRKIELPALKPLAREFVLVGQKRKAGLRPELEKVHAWLASNVVL